MQRRVWKEVPSQGKAGGDKVRVNRKHGKRDFLRFATPERKKLRGEDPVLFRKNRFRLPLSKLGIARSAREPVTEGGGG